MKHDHTLLTEYHEKRNQYMESLAMKSSEMPRQSRKEVMDQYDRIKKNSQRCQFPSSEEKQD